MRSTNVSTLFEFQAKRNNRISSKSTNTTIPFEIGFYWLLQMPDRLSWSHFDGPSPVRFLVEPNELCIPTADQTIQSTKSSTKFETIQIMQFDFMQCCAAGAGVRLPDDVLSMDSVSARFLFGMHKTLRSCMENGQIVLKISAIFLWFPSQASSMCECMFVYVCVRVHSFIDTTPNGT